MILGRFYLKLTSNGNLHGEFSNYSMNRITAESADFIPNESYNGFVGRFRSTWLEIDGPTFSDLQIQFNENTQIFTLIWRNTNERAIFHGEGFLIDDILIGDYMDNELHIRLQELGALRN